MSKILVIEDELSIRELINELLTLADFEVVEAEDGQQGIEQALSTLPDLILCDIMMPYKNGYEVLQELQCHPETESIPFIFLTAKGTKFDIRQGMNLGADDYLTKPFTEDELLQTINIRLKKRFSIEQRYALELSKTKEQLNYLFHYDALTGLPNQWSLREIFNQMVSEVKSSLSGSEIPTPQTRQPLIPILSLGLDRFRRINQNFGYDLGDSVLKLVAQFLNNCLGSRGVLARLTGDEFAIIIHPIEDEKKFLSLLKSYFKLVLNLW